MQYKTSFVLLTIGNFLATGMEFAGVLVLFDRFGSLRGWALPEVALLYGMAHVAFALSEAFARGFDVFARMIRAGDFDRVLLRPRSTVLQLAGQELQLMRIGRLAQGLFVLLWATHALEVSWSPARVALLLAAVAGGACLFSGLFVLQATMAFWTIESLEMMNTVTYGGVETASYPLSIYRPWFRRFFTFCVPLASINFLPAHALLSRSVPGTSGWLLWLTPLVGVAFLGISLQLWRFGVRHYRSTGS
jgi:ABC-2 type transport system permease protein